MAKRGAPVTINWALMDDDWCCGVKSLQGIADSYKEKTGQSVTLAGIKKHYDNLGIPRDLSGKIKAKADSLVENELVKDLVKSNIKLKEADIVDANAQNNALIQIKQRKDVTRMRDIVAKLAEELENQESFNARVDCTKKLTESMKSLIDLERRVYKIDDETSVDSNKRVSIKVNFYDA